MPHDKNGNLLNVGDVVGVQAKVKSINPGLEYCNVTLETVEPMFPSTSPTTVVLNGKQVELIARAADVAAEEPAAAALAESPDPGSVAQADGA